MKRIMTVILALALLLSICGCTPTGQETPEGLQVGYAREEIMPEGQVPLAGHGNSANRISNGVLDILYATCIAFTEGDETVLMITQDLLRSTYSWSDAAREKITAATGVPGDHIMFCATHTHSAPDIGSSDARISAYKEIYMKAMVSAAQAALADRASTTLYGSKVETEGVTFVRHYLMNDGTYAGSNFGDWSSGIVDHATEGDPEMVLVKMEREGDKQDILLMNFQSHPTKVGDTTANGISADFIGAARSAFEEQTDMLFAYFTGAAGNQVNTSRIDSENSEFNYDHKSYGKELAKLAVEAMSGMTKIEGSGIKTATVDFEYACDRTGLEKLTEAKEVAALFDSTGNLTTANELAKKYGFSSVYEARGVVAHSNKPDSDTMELNALYVAGVAFVTAPYEMFSGTALQIKGGSPFDYTVVCSCANNMSDYIPTMEAYDYGCYESYTAHFARGAAEASGEKLVELLQSLQ